VQPGVSTWVYDRRMSARRAIGIIRVSQTKGRTGESFSSPKDQRRDIERFCTEQGWRLLAAHDELDVSGNALLDDRPGLSQAVTAVLTGAAEIIVGAHNERLWWNHEVRGQVLRLVREAGGEVWAVDTGCLTNGTAAEEFSSEVRTSADKLTRNQNAEKSRAAVIRAIERGVPPWSNVTPGYRRRDDGRYEPDPRTANVVERAFKMRAEGATVDAIRAFLASNGIERSFHGVDKLLSSRVVLGEIHFGKYKPNLSAHTPIVDRDLWKTVQRVKSPRGRRAKSDRLLARLGVLRCASCGSRMVVGTANRSQYWIYRCPPTGDCEHRVTIAAELVEGIVTERVREALADIEGRASAEQGAREAAQAVERAQSDLDAAIRAFSGLDGESAAVERLAELQRVRDSAQEHLDQLGGLRSAVTINAADDWDRLTLDERRALIRATVDRATVVPGRGAGRVTVHLFSE
jgi:site-specific DNA recombinase